MKHLYGMRSLFVTGVFKTPEAATRGVLYKKGVLKNFAKFKGKHLFQSLFFNKVVG